RTIRLWDLGTGQVCRVLKGHKEAVGVVQFSPDGKLLVSGGRDGTVRFWSPSTGQETDCIRCRLKSDSEDDIEHLAFSPNGAILAWAQSDSNIIRFWDVQTKKEVRRLAQPDYEIYGLGELSFSPDGRLLAWGCMNEELYLLELEGSRQARVLKG